MILRKENIKKTIALSPILVFFAMRLLPKIGLDVNWAILILMIQVALVVHAINIGAISVTLPKIGKLLLMLAVAGVLFWILTHHNTNRFLIETKYHLSNLF